MNEKTKTTSKNNGNNIISQGLKVKKVLRSTLCLVTSSIAVNLLKQKIKKPTVAVRGFRK